MRPVRRVLFLAATHGCHRAGDDLDHKTIGCPQGKNVMADASIFFPPSAVGLQARRSH